jgi:hypothetical protein
MILFGLPILIIKVQLLIDVLYKMMEISFFTMLIIVLLGPLALMEDEKENSKKKKNYNIIIFILFK